MSELKEYPVIIRRLCDDEGDGVVRARDQLAAREKLNKSQVLLYWDFKNESDRDAADYLEGLAKDGGKVVNSDIR